MDGDAARVDQIGVDEDAPDLGIEAGHFDDVARRIGPVDVARHPVDGDALGRSNACRSSNNNNNNINNNNQSGRSKTPLTRVEEDVVVGSVVAGAAQRMAVDVAPVDAALVAVDVDT